MTNAANGASFALGFTPDSNLDQKGFFVVALVGPAPDDTMDDAQPHVLQVDTGSCGIAIGVQYLSSYYQTRVKAQGEPAKLVTYLPSQNEIWGWWAELPVRLFGPAAPTPPYDPADYPATTVKVMVAAYVMVHGKTQQDFGGGMMGIGFHADPQTVMAANPLLSVTLGSQSLSAGYILSLDGIDIGLTQQNVANVTFVDLVANGGLYTGPQAALTISGQGTGVGPIACDLLMDTGVQNSMLFTDSANIPASLWEADPPVTGSTPSGGNFLPGDSFTVEVPGACRYQFTLGQASPFTPPGFMLMDRAGDASSLNTSIYLLGGYDYSLDYAGKRMGFRARA